ncbi:MAG: hypothetical protein ABIH59_01070 [archaeon]
MNNTTNIPRFIEERGCINCEISKEFKKGIAKILALTMRPKQDV